MPVGGSCSSNPRMAVYWKSCSRAHGAPKRKPKVLISVEEEMANQSTGGDKRIDRRSVLQVGTALAATGLLHGRDAEAQ